MGKRDTGGLEGADTHYSLESLMSRTGSFPLRIAHQLLNEYGVARGIVFDPFCGKGTTLSAARLLGCPAYGIDIAPEAAICAAAKLVDVRYDRVQDYIEGLRLDTPVHATVPDTVKTFFHQDTLRQVLRVRDQLLQTLTDGSEPDRSSATFVLACLLGILHGHASFSLSIPSAHAYAMAPRYVERYAATRGLTVPMRDVKRCLLEKARRCLNGQLPPPVPWEVKTGSATDSSKLFPNLVGRVDTILTSPPYFNAQTYAKDNWLRLWLLGYDYKSLQAGYIQTGSLERYRRLMGCVLQEFSAMLRPGGRLICVAGDVTLRTGNRRIEVQTGTILAELCEQTCAALRLETQLEHVVSAHRRYLYPLSRSNAHSKRNLTERVFVARKVAQA